MSMGGRAQNIKEERIVKTTLWNISFMIFP